MVIKPGTLRTVSLCLLQSGLAVFLGGCGSSTPPPVEPVYSIATRQLPPEPGYSRTSWAVLPQPIPGDLRVLGARMSQKMAVNISSEPLGSASSRIGKLFGYRSYCAGTISDRRVTLKERGDLDELAEALAAKASIRVVVDHENRELRLFALDSAVAR